MENTYKQVLWKNFAAAIDMLKETIILCPDDLWQAGSRFYFLAYHTTIFLDYYLTKPVKEFVPILPYTIIDPNKLPAEAVDDVIPNEIYDRNEVIDYLSITREKCRKMILLSTTDDLMDRWIDQPEINQHGLCPSLVIRYSVLEILFYNLRHIQHHVGQLNYMLRQHINRAPEWISHAG